MGSHTVEMLVTINLHTGNRRVYVNGRRVSEARYSEYRAIGCFFSESTSAVRRLHAVGVLKSSEVK